MATQSELMGAGIPWRPAAMLGLVENSSVSAAGTTQATATALTASFSIVTTAAANSGVQLPTATGSGTFIVVNNGANTVTVYPATGEAINANAANVGIQIAVGKSASFHGCGQTWGAVISG